MNEIEVTITKAAVGRGLDHGVASEVGRAARYLCERDRDGISAAVHTLSDSGLTVASGISAIDQAVATGEPVVVEACLDVDMLEALAELCRCELRGDQSEIVVVPAPETDPRVSTTNTFPASTAWDTVLTWAAETYVPSTEQSRVSGAGAGLTDND